MTVEVVIPWRGGCPHRAAALVWVCARWAEHFPDAVVTVAEQTEGAWRKALAVTPAVERSDADVIVVADADVWVTPEVVADAIDKAGRKLCGWAMPHRMVNRLTEDATARLIAGELAWPDIPDLDEAPYVGTAGGGMVVIRRDAYVDCPLDPRFEGWGGEDGAWGQALDGWLGNCWAGGAPLLHLWHPPQARRDRVVGNEQSEQLRRLYVMSGGHRPSLGRLLEEAKAWPNVPSD
jgi:hypothetical protein